MRVSTPCRIWSCRIKSKKECQPLDCSRILEHYLLYFGSTPARVSARTAHRETVVGPLLGQIELTVQETGSLQGRIGQKDAHLGIFDASGGAGVLPSAPCRRFMDTFQMFL